MMNLQRFEYNRIQISSMRFELLQPGIAQGLDLRIKPGKDASALLALRASLRVFGTGQGAHGARITDHDL